jgi:hypothetical protein
VYKKQERGKSNLLTIVQITMKATQKFFPYKLYRLLETIGKTTSAGDIEACIMWISHGRAFIIRNEDVFASRVMSAYFKQTRFRSFIRQLLLWGFKRYALVRFTVLHQC